MKKEILLTSGDLNLIQNLDELLYGEFSLDENPRPKYKDGTPAHTRFVTHNTETYMLRKGEYPITTLMETAHKWGRGEILWIYQDASNSLALLEEKYGVMWWRDWDVGDNTIGHRYGAVVNELNLMQNLLDGILKDPYNRGWQMNLLQNVVGPGLRPCAYLTEWSVVNIKGQLYLDMKLTQRSNDYISAGYINKSQYVALQEMVAGHLRYHGMDIKVGKFTHSITNLHIYDRHIHIAEDIYRNGKEKIDTGDYQIIQPKFVLKEDKDFYSYNVNDIVVEPYPFTPKIDRPELAI